MQQVFILFLIFTLLPAPGVRAEESCVAAYEQAADQYWPIIGDIIQFKALFDDYDRLCQMHYPDDMAALQPAADQLRRQTRRDFDSTKPAMMAIFEDTLPKTVPPACRDDDAARQLVQKKFMAAITEKSDRINARMKKSASTLRTPKESLTLCQQLKPLKPKIEKVLGPELDHPLLEISILNRMLTKKPRHDKQALKNYRATLGALPVSTPPIPGKKPAR